MKVPFSESKVSRESDMVAGWPFLLPGNSMSVSLVGTAKGAYTGLIRNINIIGGSG